MFEFHHSSQNQLLHVRSSFTTSVFSWEFFYRWEYILNLKSWKKYVSLQDENAVK